MILFFGPPGSGKSVQGKLLVERNGWQWLSTGALFRVSKDPEVLRHLATGELIDDPLTNRVLDQALKSIDKSVEVVLDGYPRNLDQVRWLANHLPLYQRKIACLILFEVPRKELVSRLSGRGREEDTMDVIERRLDIYKQKTKPVIDFYRQDKTCIFIIDGTGSVEAVHERIQSAVKQCLKDK